MTSSFKIVYLLWLAVGIVRIAQCQLEAEFFFSNLYDECALPGGIIVDGSTDDGGLCAIVKGTGRVYICDQR